MIEPERLFDVAIVGYGPVGAMLANLLGQAGLSVIIFERDASIYQLPRAVHFDGEVMRVFQSADLAEPIAKIARATSKGMHFVNSQGQTLLVRRGTEGPGPHGWANNWYFHQPWLEQALRDGVTRFSNVQIKLWHEVFHIEQTGERAVLEVEDKSCGEVKQWQACYVVGCDGARSLLRQRIGSASEDLGLHQPWLVVDVLVNLASERVQRLPDYTVQWCDPQRPMTAVYVGGDRRRWEIMLLPNDDPTQLQQPDHFWPLLRHWIRPEDARIERSALYTFHSIIALGWRDRRLLLAGDSAHQTPPFLGQGMCAGIRDVANLAWKLIRVARGQADESLLDSYESERRPHVKAFIELAVKLGNIIQTTAPERAALRDRQFREGQPHLFDFPQPQLGPGLRTDAPPPVGTVFSQPRLPDGRWLDEVAGHHFAIIGARALFDAADQATQRIWQILEAVIIDTPGAEIEAWLKQYNAQALILRPDRYVFGLARNPEELQALSRLLPSGRIRELLQEPEN